MSFADHMTDGYRETQKKELEALSGSSVDNIWEFANYTLTNHKEDLEKSEALLNFIWSCLEMSERNIQNINNS